MQQLTDVIKPSLRSKVSGNNIPNFLKRLDKNAKYQADIWDKKTYKVDPKTHVFTTIQEHFGNRLIRNIKLPKDAVVVDIGCFVGEKLWQVDSTNNYLGIGVDIAIDSLKTAQAIDVQGHKFIAADMEDLPFKSNSVDLVMVFDVIEHLTHAEKGFSEVARILKPGGQFLLHIPIKDNKWSMFWWKQKLFPNAAIKDYLDVGHSDDRMLTSKQIKQHLKKNGMNLEKEIFYNSFFVHFWDREFFRILASLFVRIFKGGKHISNGSRTTHQGSASHLRNLYGLYVIPLLELLSFPDKYFSSLKIGNTYFVIAQKK
jgi:ubiquinone/menaquinone biosynthesis C-methylase UbiE